MSDLKKYSGVIPAFYACYDDQGTVSPQRVQELTRYLIEKGVNGLYVGGSSGECIYQSVDERKTVLENVMAQAKGKIAVIAHVACNNTADSRILAAHAEGLGVDAVASIPPSTSTCPSTPSPSTGTISPPPRPIRILSSIISPSWPAWH